MTPLYCFLISLLTLVFKNVTQMQRKRSIEEEEESVTAVQRERKRKKVENERQVSGVSL